MSLKSRILLILGVASVFTAMATAAVIIFLIQLHGEISFDSSRSILFTALSFAVYLIGVLWLLGLLAMLLNKTVIIPTVEREMLDNERQMLTEQLHHSQKMEAVGRLAGSIAHDFNNLLTIIDGYSSLIIADPASKETASNAHEVVEAARKASFITRKLLSFSHKEQADPVILDLNTALADADKMLSRLIGEKINLVTQFSKEAIYVKGDPVQLGQVLMNLSVNARDAMPHGGRITIKTELKEVVDDEHRKPSDVPAGDYALISVRDTGEGIDPDTVDRIFEPFFTTKESGKGTGLGLSIVKTIIKKFGGFIDLTSKLGGGTTFMLFIPLASLEEAEETVEAVDEPVPHAVPEPEPEAPVENETESEPDREMPSGKTILLVEDDPMIRSLVSQTLESCGYHVLIADDGWQAAQAARKYDGTIDLLFTDVVMPGLGGAELALAVAELHPDIISLFMSGYSRAQVSEEGVPPDAPLLEKPFTPDKVVETIKNLIDG